MQICRYADMQMVEINKWLYCKQRVGSYLANSYKLMTSDLALSASCFVFFTTENTE